tara:strand:+ start:1350 stop:2255 length:906 start_codon:yes stop_codon:yes gene_type:complete
MKILVVGLGGVGGYIGSCLEKSDFKTTYLCRGKRLTFIKKNGLIINSLNKKKIIQNLDVRDSLSNSESFDIIINTVKLYDFDAVLTEVLEKIKKNYIFLPFQNGIYSEEKIKETLGLKNTYGAVAQISSVVNSEQEIDHIGKLATFFVGRYDQQYDKKLDFFCQECQKIGLDIRFKNNIKEKIWDKFIFLSAYSGITTLTEKTIGEIFETPELKKKFIEAMHETYNLSKSYGINFKSNPVKSWLEKIDKMPSEMTSSMFYDFKKNKRLELRWLSGSIVNFSKEKKVDCPTHLEILNGIESK